MLISISALVKIRSYPRSYILHGLRTRNLKARFSSTTLILFHLKPLPSSSPWYGLWNLIPFRNSTDQHYRLISVCEWSTGTFTQSKFFEKDVIDTHKSYRLEVEAWSAINSVVIKNICKKLFNR